MEKVKAFFRNLSLKTSFILYVLAALLLALLLYAVTDRIASQIIFHPAMEKSLVIEELSFAVLQAIRHWAIPGYVTVCVILAAFLFYRNKIARPVAVLKEASGKIAGHTLDFSVDYGSRDELGMVCGAFEEMRGALAQNYASMWRQAEQRKQLNAMFAHDLRTPLTVLKGYAEILQQADDPKTKHTAATMTKHICRMERYLDSMGRMQKIEDAQPEYQAVDLGGLLQSMEQTAALMCRSAGKKLDFQSGVPSGAPVSLDPDMILHAVENLVSNAVCYAKNKIVVSVSENSGTLTVAVRDDGDGFSAESLKRATEPYYSTNADRAAHFGLGLYVSGLLCGRHGGGLATRNDGGAMVTASFQIKNVG